MRPRAPHWLARGLLAAARRILPAGRREWGDAMQAELAHLSGFAATSWALGCMLAAIREGFMSKRIGPLHVSRAVLLIETLGSFGSLTVGWLVILFAPSGVARLNAERIENYTSFPGGTFALVMLLLCALVASIGPIGLVLGVRRVIDQRASFSRVLGWVMVGALLAYGALGVGVKLLAGPDAFGFAWYEALLLFLLPAAVLTHLMYLGRNSQAAGPVAA